VEDKNTERGVRKHLSDKGTWIRLLYMILFGIAFEVAKFVTFFVAAVQILFKLLTGDVQPRLSGFGGSLAIFLRQVVDFMTFRSEIKPYPWSAWPSPDETVADAPVAATADGAPPIVPATRSKRMGGRRKADASPDSDAKQE